MENSGTAGLMSTTLEEPLQKLPFARTYAEAGWTTILYPRLAAFRCRDDISRWVRLFSKSVVPRSTQSWPWVNMRYTRHARYLAMALIALPAPSLIRSDR